MPKLDIKDNKTLVAPNGASYFKDISDINSLLSGSTDEGIKLTNEDIKLEGNAIKGSSFKSYIEIALIHVRVGSAIPM